MNIKEEFEKRAAAAGLTQEQIAAFVASNFPAEKTAEEQLDEAYSALIDAAGVEKTAEVVAYLDGFLKQAVATGYSPEDAADVSVAALASVFPSKTKEASVEEQQAAAYYQGVFEKAASLGVSQQQAVALLQKQANPLAAAAGAGGAPGADGGMLQQLLALIQSNPELAASLGGGAPGAGAAGQLPSMLKSL